MINKNALLIIDVQGKIINPIKNKELIIKNIKKLLNAYEILDSNIFISEQNPSKLGKTINEIVPINHFKLIEKNSFSLGNNSQVCNELFSKDIKNLIICGFETHICVQQSVLDFMKKDFEVYVIADAIGSRKLNDHDIALQRMISQGALISSTESIIFELCKTSERKEFKQISNIIKSN